MTTTTANNNDQILSESAVSEIEARVSNVVLGPRCSHLDPLIRGDIPALCATVKHLRAEREKAIKLLSPDIPRTDLCDAARQIVFAHALEKGSAEKLQSQLEQLRAENEALKKWQRDVEEREAAVCPEDVPFDEYIWALKKRAAQAREDRDELSTEIETCHSLLDQFYAEDPVMTSADTLEKRLRLHLDELRPVITDDGVNGDD